MVRIGIVGLGFMGMIHYLPARQLQGGEVVAVCSWDRTKLVGDWRSIQCNFGPRAEMDKTVHSQYQHNFASHSIPSA